MNSENPANPWVEIRMIPPQSGKPYMVLMRRHSFLVKDGEYRAAHQSVLGQAYCTYEELSYLELEPIPHWWDVEAQPLEYGVTHYKELECLPKGCDYVRRDVTDDP